MTNRIHEYFNPSPVTRLLSLGRQLQRVQQLVTRISSHCEAAKTLGTTEVRIIGVVLSEVLGSSYPYFMAVPATSPLANSVTPVFVQWHDLE